MPFGPNLPFDPNDPSQWWWARMLQRNPVQPNATPSGVPGSSLDPDGLDDWIAPAPAPSQTEHPNDWIAPGNARTDSSYLDDWIHPGSNAPAAIAPSAAPLAPSKQPSVAAPGLSNRQLPPPDPLAAYWSLIPASRAVATAWQPPVFLPPNPFSHENIPASAWVTPPPIFLNSPQPFPSVSPAPLANPPSAAAEGLLGGIPKMLAASASSDFLHDSAGQGLLGGIPKLLAASASLDPFWTPGSWGLLGALAGLQPAASSAQADASYAPGSRSLLSNPIGNQGSGGPLAYLRGDWPNRPDSVGSASNQLSTDEAFDLAPDTGQVGPSARVLLVGGDEEEDQHNTKPDPAVFTGLTDKSLGSSPKELPHLPMLLPLFPRGGPPPTSASQPAPRPSLPPPFSTQPGALPPPSPGSAANSPRPIGPPIGPARVPASAEASESEASNRGGADPIARGVPSPAPMEQGKGPPVSAPPNWPKLVGDIKDALPSGPERVRAVISAGLPKYDKKTTYGVLITNEGDVVPLQSCDADPRYNNYPPASHVEGKAAIWIRDNGSTGGVVYHNNTDGTCGYCNSQIVRLLPHKKELLVIPPADAVATKRGATAYPTPHVGDDVIPNPPKQSDFFWNWP